MLPASCQQPTLHRHGSVENTRDQGCNVGLTSSLSDTNLTQCTHVRGDQIEVFKILNGYEHIDRHIFVSLKKVSSTR